MTHDQRIAGLMILALIAVGLADCVWYYRTWWRDRLAAVQAWCGTPVYAGAHRAANLPRSGPTVNAAEGATPVNAARPGEPGWDEDDDETLTWLTELVDEVQLSQTQEWATLTDPPDDTAELDYDAPVPADAIRTERIGGTHVPNLGYDPAELNLPRPGHMPVPPGPGQPYHPRSGPPAWHPPKPFEPWTWNGRQWIRQAPAGALWIDVLCTMPLRQLEAAQA
jgi:hypothetical protein